MNVSRETMRMCAVNIVFYVTLKKDKSSMFHVKHFHNASKFKYRSSNKNCRGSEVQRPTLADTLNLCVA